MNKNNISIKCLYALFLLLATSMNAVAQGSGEQENYFSNPQKGIKPSAPKPYVDSLVVFKSDDITVELTGVIPDTVTPKDTTSDKFILDRRSLNTEGYSLYPYDPWFHTWHGPNYGSWHHTWYSSFYDPWYFSWGYDGWMFSHCWTCSPYWSWHFSWGWSPYWSWHFSWGWSPYWSIGWSYPWYSTTVSMGSVRRGGVDLNNGGRAPYGRISGTGSVGNRGSSNGSRNPVTRGNTRSTRGTAGRYAKPSTSVSGRASSTATRTSNASRGTTTRSGNISRFRTDNSSRSSYRNSSTPSRNNSYRSNTTRSYNSPSRSSSSSFRSSGGSSSFRSSGSPSRSSGSSFRSSGGATSRSHR